jgi:hypothetical protein
LSQRAAKDQAPQIPGPEFEMSLGKELSVCPLGERLVCDGLSMSKANWSADSLEDEGEPLVRHQSGLAVDLATDKEGVDGSGYLAGGRADRRYLGKENRQS